MEAGSRTPAAKLGNRASRVASVRLLYPEARAALAQAQRNRRLTARQLRQDAVRGLEDHYEQLDLVELDETLAQDAGDLAEARGLRGHDAVRLAAARRLDDADLVVATGDTALLTAAKRLGLNTTTTAGTEEP